MDRLCNQHRSQALVNPILGYVIVTQDENTLTASGAIATVGISGVVIVTQEGDSVEIMQSLWRPQSDASSPWSEQAPSTDIWTVQTPASSTWEEQ